MYNTGVIYFSEKNVHGAWVVYGLAGIKQYYGYTKREAERRYREEYNKTFIVNKTSIQRKENVGNILW